MHCAPTDHDLGMAKQRLETLVDSPISASLGTRGLLYDSVIRELSGCRLRRSRRLEKAERQTLEVSS
jgi:hypothetical protein